MSCTTCIKIQSLPECLDANETFTFTGITFDSVPDTIVLHDTATGRNITFDFDLDLSEIFPLMNHTYEVSFFDEDLNEIAFTIDTDVRGCCLEFNVRDGISWGGGNFAVTSLKCEAV